MKFGANVPTAKVADIFEMFTLTSKFDDQTRVFFIFCVGKIVGRMSRNLFIKTMDESTKANDEL